VRLDGGLRWGDQIESLASTLSKNVFVLRNVASLNNIKLSKMVYHSLFESYIRYSIVLWGNSSKQNLNKIFIIQKRAIRCMMGLKQTDSCVLHFQNLEILTVPSLFMYETILYVIDNSLVTSHSHRYNTRNRSINPSTHHNLKLFEQKPGYIGLKFFAMLPSELRDFSNISSFKNNLKAYLIQKCYYELPSFLT
jgi:hypothetical protein